MMASAATNRTGTGGTDFFDTQAERWVGLYESKPGFRDRLNLFAGSLGSVLPAPARVLDFGCGPGVIALALAGRGYEVVGLDGAPRMIEQARAEAARRGIANVRFEAVSAGEVPVAPASFDAIVCSSVIEYVADDAKLVGDLVRALRPGGYLLISVPHTDSFVGMLEDGLRKLAVYARRTGSRHLTYSLRRYRRDRFAGLLETLGIVPLDFRYFETPLPSAFGVALSRWRRVGVMMLAIGRKRDGVEAGAPDPTTASRSAR
jgi:2-polyprenyl-6-hydroxyphenyl methylase/3-demethylubiquinone-9 3-methyltransferase